MMNVKNGGKNRLYFRGDFSNKNCIEHEKEIKKKRKSVSKLKFSVVLSFLEFYFPFGLSFSHLKVEKDKENEVLPCKYAVKPLLLRRDRSIKRISRLKEKNPEA
ncbi:hypothetical protein V6Z11_A10G186300 [Gossypium hirsutum]